MRLYLDILEGPAQGKKISLSSKTSFGRKGADVEIDDPKLSGIHAFFDYSDKEGWSILDNESRNGVWVNGLKELKIVIRDGDLVHLGETKILCRMLEGNQPKYSEPFQLWIQSLVKKVKNTKLPLKEVKPEIRIKSIQGEQYGSYWDIFYGPRVAGREHPDICLYESGAPEEAFRIEVKGTYAYFHTDHENIVKINDESVKTKQFEPGDVISIGESQFAVEFDEGNGFSS